MHITEKAMLVTVSVTALVTGINFQKITCLK